MSGQFRYPDIKGKTPVEQIAEMKRFLWQLIDELNYASSAGDTKKEQAQTVVKEPGKNDADLIRTITLPAAAWSGTSSPYSQSVTIAGTSGSSRIELMPSKDVVMSLFSAGIALGTENNNGTIVVYALGNRPSTDITMQVAISKTKI